MAHSIPGHPLFNHLVLEKVLLNLDFRDLKSFRLVCSLWNDIALPHVIKTAELYLEGTRFEQFLVTYSEGNHCLAPFENYTLKINSALSFNANIRTMWEEISGSVKHLTLYITTRYAYRELKWLLLHNLPSLKRLKIVVTKYWGEVSEDHGNETVQGNSSSFEESEIKPNVELNLFQLSYLGSISVYGIPDVNEDDFCFPIEWNVFFTRFPKVNHLSLVGLNSLDISKMIEALEDIEQHQAATQSIPVSLEILDENMYPETPNDNHLSHLGTFTPNAFQSLHLELSPTVSTSILNQVFENNSRSLESLRLRRYPHPHLTVPVTLTAVNLNNVSFLEVSDAMLPSLSFLPFFPSLKILHIILRDYRSLPSCEILQNTPNPERVMHSNLRSLYIEPPLVSNECVKKLAVCFPNLESLRLRANDEILVEICSEANGENSAWSKSISNLYITSWDGLTDEGLTGINEKILKFWGAYSSFEAKKYRTKPYIGNISNLKNLTIEMWSDYENHISDWSIYYGILDLERLEEISLIRSGISSTALKTIPLPASKKLLIN